jgi:hypothetical protein
MQSHDEFRSTIPVSTTNDAISVTDSAIRTPPSVRRFLREME